MTTVAEGVGSRLAAAALVACALHPSSAGWVESYDKKSNKKFYYDEETRKTQWEKPDGNGRREDEHGIGCPRWRHRTLGGVRPGRS